jgi:ribonuclease VapC
LIVVDTSALLAVLQGEAEADACAEAMSANDRLLIAAPTLTEALIVAARRDLHSELEHLVEGLPLAIVPLTEPRIYDAVRAYIQWGKGFHPAKLNFGDSFAYALAKEHDCPLLFVGNDFVLTDVVSALP